MIYQNQTEFCLNFQNIDNCHQNFPNQSEFGLEYVSWNFFFPNQTVIGLENPTNFLGVTFPNQTGFVLEKGIEYNVAELQVASFTVRCKYINCFV